MSDYPNLKHGDIVEIVWDGGNGPHTYEVHIEHGVPVAWTTGHAPMRVSPITKTWVRAVTRLTRPASPGKEGE